MKTFRKAIKDSEYAIAGQPRNKLFLKLLAGTEHDKAFRKIAAKYPMKQAQHIYLNSVSKCRCGKAARWNKRLGTYSEWCGLKCQNSDPAKIALQQKSEWTTKKAQVEKLETLRTQHLGREKAPTEKQISKFQKVFASLAKETHEHSVVKALPEKLLPLWFNLNHESFRYRKRIALGEIPFQSYCLECGKPVGCTMRGDWGKYCSNNCANIANYAKRLSPEATQKMTAALRKKFSVPKEAHKLSKRLKVGFQEKYGERNPSQVPEIARRQRGSMSRTKTYKLGGQEVKVQGYEPRALDILLRTYKVSEVRVETEGGVPHIEYDQKGVRHVHYPDIFLPKLNQLIEVKSTYTGFGSAQTWNTNQAKAEAAVKAGYRYTIFLFDRKGGRIKLPHGWVRMTFAQIIKWFKQYQEGA